MFTIRPVTRACSAGSLFVMLLASCGGGSTSPVEETVAADSFAASASFRNSVSASVSVDVAAPGVPVNRGLLGNNTQWVDNGDGLVTAAGQPQSTIVDALRPIAPTVLRYPGGTLTDTYRWRDGVGPVATRGYNRDLINNMKKVVFGTDEFLQLASTLGSTPLFTVNVVTAEANEAAEWVAYVNGTGATQKQRVQYWEIGNEPYLQETERPDLSLTPADFSARATKAILAMKAVDPKIKVGLPLRSDTIGGVPATPYQGFNKTVLTSVKAPVDFVSVHNAYLPFAYTSATVADSDLYRAAMAAVKVLSADLDATSSQVKALRPNETLPIAVTEYNALFGLSTPRLFQYSTSLAGALYVADSLSMLSARKDILTANIWSATGNGSFGATDFSGKPRPIYHVLQAYNQLLQGQMLTAQVSAPTFSNPQVGMVPARSDTPLVSANVTRDGKMLRVALINKHPTSALTVSLKIANGRAAGGATYAQLNGTDLFSGAEGRSPVSWTTGNASGTGNTLTWNLPAHSFTFYQIPLV